MPTSYNATHSHRSPFPSIFHPLASVFFSHPCWLRPLGATSDLRLSGGLNERMESSGRFFRGNFYALAIVKLSTSFLSRKRSLVARASSGTFEYLSVSWVYSFLLISPIFSWREGRVFLVRFCSSMRVTGKLKIVFRDLFRALQRERVYKEFLKRLRKKNRILKSFFLLSFLQYRVTNSIVYNYHTVNQKIT